MAGGGRTIKAVVACHLSHKPFVKPGNSVIQEYMWFCFSYGPSHGILTSRCLEVFRVYNFPSAGALATLAGFWAQVLTHSSIKLLQQWIHRLSLCYSAGKKQRKNVTCILRKANCQRRLADLLLEKILFVEEQNDGSVGKPLVVADGIKQIHAFHHSILHRRSSMILPTIYQIIIYLDFLLLISILNCFY